MRVPEPPAPQPLTLRAALNSAVLRLRARGITGAGNDARRLAAGMLGLSSAALLSAPQRALSAQEAERFGRAIERRLAHEPVARILGVREFYGLSFTLCPATLDPRPDSETVVSAALALAREEGWLLAPVRILDVGTGCGCLLLSLLSELPHATGVGTDISPAALRCALLNARRLNVEHRCHFVAADALEGLAGCFDLMLSNPPYIASAEIARLEPEVRLYDPHAALDGGSDGLEMYRRLAAGMVRLTPNGWTILEVGHDQADAVLALLAERMQARETATFRQFRDVAGRRRCVATRTRSSRAQMMISSQTP